MIKIAVLGGQLFAWFWDEYGVSVGATAIPDLLTADQWNHLFISREFETGRIKVILNIDLFLSKHKRKTMLL